MEDIILAIGVITMAIGLRMYSIRAMVVFIGAVIVAFAIQAARSEPHA